MWTLTMCMGVWLGICTQYVERDFGSAEACERERAYQAANARPAWALCAPKRPKDREGRL